MAKLTTVDPSVAKLWDEAKHSRDWHGKFASMGAARVDKPAAKGSIFPKKLGGWKNSRGLQPAMDQHKVMVDHYKSWHMNKLTPLEGAILYTHRGVNGKAESVNAWLRGTNPKQKEIEADPAVKKIMGQYAGYMDSAIAKAPPLKEPVAVYRGIHGMLPPPKGSTFKDKAFTSTSLSPAVAEDFRVANPDGSAGKYLKPTIPGYVTEIALPPGTKAAYMDVIQGFPKAPFEVEMVLPRNSTYMVGDTRTDPSGVKIVEMNLVP